MSHSSELGYTVGDLVTVFHTSPNREPVPGKVERISPTGNVTVRVAGLTVYTFMPHGRERGTANMRRHSFLVPKAEQDAKLGAEREYFAGRHFADLASTELDKLAARARGSSLTFSEGAERAAYVAALRSLADRLAGL